jgi:deoxyhypusine synthase
MDKAGFRKRLLKTRVVDAKVVPGMSVVSLFEEYAKMGGFTSRYLADALTILSDILEDKRSVNFISFPADIVSTGLRGVLAQLIRTGRFKVLITTCGALDHDIARANGAKYCFGTFDTDDTELREVGVSRLGNIFIPVEDYGELTEKFLYKTLGDAVAIKETWGVRELVDFMGDRLPHDENSILKAARDAGTRIYVPGFVDGAVGTHVFTYSQTHKLKIDIFRDMAELSEIVFEAEKTGALIIGGGISKHHTIWWNQFKDGLDYAVYLTTAMEYDGSLSGAKPKEAISWNKIKPKAKHTVVIGDATITLPLLAAAALSGYTARLLG